MKVGMYMNNRRGRAEYYALRPRRALTFNVRKLLLFFSPRIPASRAVLPAAPGIWRGVRHAESRQRQANRLAGERGKIACFSPGTVLRGRPRTTAVYIAVRATETGRRNFENFFTILLLPPPIPDAVPGVHFPRRPPPFVLLLQVSCGMYIYTAVIYRCIYMHGRPPPPRVRDQFISRSPRAPYCIQGESTSHAAVDSCWKVHFGRGWFFGIFFFFFIFSTPTTERPDLKHFRKIAADVDFDSRFVSNANILHFYVLNVYTAPFKFGETSERAKICRAI